MQSKVNRLLRGLDSLTAQITERRSAARAQEKKLSDPLASALDDHIEQIRELTGKLVIPELEDHPAVGESPRLYEKLASLFGVVNGVNARPTDAQQTHFHELEAELEQLGNETARYLESLVDLDGALRGEGMPGLLVPEAP
jgi:hypothetical protein